MINHTSPNLGASLLASVARANSIQQTGTQKQGKRSSPASVLLAFLLTAVLWFAFVGTKNPHELEVGFVSAILAVLFSAFVGRRSQSRISLPLKDLLQAWRIPGYVLSDIWQITVVLAKDLLNISPAKSLFRVCPFALSDDDSINLGRRVLATAYTTATPSIIVIGIDVEQHRMLFHQIERTDIPVMTRALGAHS